MRGLAAIVVVGACHAAVPHPAPPAAPPSVCDLPPAPLGNDPVPPLPDWLREGRPAYEAPAVRLAGPAPARLTPGGPPLPAPVESLATARLVLAPDGTQVRVAVGAGYSPFEIVVYVPATAIATVTTRRTFIAVVAAASVPLVEDNADRSPGAWVPAGTPVNERASATGVPSDQLAVHLVAGAAEVVGVVALDHVGASFTVEPYPDGVGRDARPTHHVDADVAWLDSPGGQLLATPTTERMDVRLLEERDGSALVRWVQPAQDVVIVGWVPARAPSDRRTRAPSDRRRQCVRLQQR